MQIKSAWLRPAEELGCLGGWKKKKTSVRQGSLNIVLSPLLSQQSGTFDGRRQATAECGGWSSPLVRQLSAPQSPQSLRRLHVLWEPSKLGTSAR